MEASSSSMSTSHFTLSFFLLFISLSCSLGGAPPSTSKPQTHLARGAHLAVGDHITSSDNTFTFGFFGGRNFSTNAYWLAVWFTRSPTPNGTVWMANRDKPVNGHGSRLTFRKNGALVLSDLDGSITWQTDTASNSADGLELLDSGNLVLRTSTGEIIWQSFDNPTDTLLPGQLFTKDTTLVSALGAGNFGSGYFSLFFDVDNVLKLMYNGPQITSLYWPYTIDQSPYQRLRLRDNSTRIAVLDDQGLISSSDQLEGMASDAGIPGIKRMLKMDHDGNLRIYSLNDASGSWSVTFEAVGAQCLIHGLCGENAICIYRPEHGCSCPPGYEQANSTDWSQGCKPMFQKTCSDSMFVEVKNTDYYGFDLTKTFGGINFEGCKKLCLEDCRCLAFNYRETGEAFCFTKNTLFSGYSASHFPGSTYIRLPTNSTFGPSMAAAVLTIPDNNWSLKTINLSDSVAFTSQHARWTYLYSFASALGVIEAVILACGWFFLFGKHGIPNSLEDGYRALSSQFRSFNYGELKIATHQFNNVLGKGGFGTVYRGCLEDGREVAVKKLADVLAEEEFWAEVSTIGKINHMNLVRMWGFCSEKKRRLLVYEYIENGSLDRHLFAPGYLSWKARFKIATGTARGLAYLHHECLEWIIHCDVKPENILLDASFDPKIADFGLAKLCQRGGPAGAAQATRKIRGTKGYMAPEWTINLPTTAKVDVYSYGVVVLELVKGIRLSGMVQDGESELARLERTARGRRVAAGDGKDLSWLDELVDPRLEGKFSRRQAAAMVEIGLCCIDEDRNRRPTMDSVAQLLLECEDS